MPYINYAQKEVAFKIVYFGPGMSGKTTNLLHIHKKLSPKIKGEMLTLDTAEERTLFFDFFPLELGKVEGYSVRFNMYTVPGQVYYEASRKLILDGADGVVFVADSQSERYDENIESYQMMQENLRSYNLDEKVFPLILQYNKRDVPNPLPMGKLEEGLGLSGITVTQAIAIRGMGVMETIHKMARQIIVQFQL